MSHSNGSGPPIWGTVYIPEVNGARKVKSDVLLPMNKSSNSMQNLFLVGGWEDSTQTQIFPNF